MENKELKSKVERYCEVKRQIKALNKVCEELKPEIDERGRQIFNNLIENGVCFDISECDKVDFATETFSFFEYVEDGEYDEGYVCGGTMVCNMPLASLYDDDELARETKYILDAQKKYDGFIDKMEEDRQRELYEKLKQRFEPETSLK